MPRLPKNQSNPYPGKVTKTIKVPPPPRLLSFYGEPTDEQKRDHQKKLEDHNKVASVMAAAESVEKMGLLLDYYNIDRNDEDKWFSLAFKLARNHIEGFSLSTEKQKGAPTKWNISLYLELYDDVNNKIFSAPGKSISWACEQLVKKQPWKDILVGGKGKSLENKYIESQNTELVRLYKSLLDDPRIKNLAPKLAELVRTSRTQKTSQ